MLISNMLEVVTVEVASLITEIATSGMAVNTKKVTNLKKESAGQTSSKTLSC